MLSIPLNEATHRRLKTVVRRIGTTMAHVGRDAVLDKLETLEGKFREAKEKKAAFRKLGESPLGPTTPDTSVAATATNDDDPVETSLAATAPIPVQAPVVQAPIDPLADIYELHAQKIFEALSDPTEKRIRIEEALTAIQAEYPIIAPPDDEIRTKLQNVVQRLRAEERAAAKVAAAPPVSPYASPIPPLPPLPSRAGRTIAPLKPRYVGLKPAYMK